MIPDVDDDVPLDLEDIRREPWLCLSCGAYHLVDYDRELERCPVCRSTYVQPYQDEGF